jgi:hypothetical protein
VTSLPSAAVQRLGVTLAAAGGARLLLFLAGAPRVGQYSPLDNVVFPPLELALYQVMILALAGLLAIKFPRPPISLIETAVAVRPTIFLVGVFLFVLITANAIAFFVLGNFPRDVDDVARVFQARIFASGRLYVDAPPMPEAFHVANVVIADGRMYSKYEPGSALVYALWHTLSHVEWGANAALGATVTLLLYWIIKPLYEERIVRLAVLLLCFSPFFVFMISTFHSHTATLFFLGIFVLMLRVAWTSCRRWPLAVAGLGLGLAGITRPYTAFLVGLPFGIWLLAAPGRWPARILRLLLVGAGVALPLSALLYYNDHLTGKAFRFPFLVSGPDQRIGFGHMGHTPWKGFRNTAVMLEVLNLNLFGWPASLMFAVVFVLISRKQLWDRLFLAGAVSLIVGYAAYYWIDFSFGPRFYFESLLFLVVLTARGVFELPSRVRRAMARPVSSSTLTAFVLWTLILSFAFSAVVYLPLLVRKYHNHYNHIVDTQVAQLAARDGVTNALVLMRSVEGQNLYASGFLANDLDFRGNVVYARDRGSEENQWLISAYPGRAVFLFTYEGDGKGHFSRLGP